jgi:hypothetical protein
LDGSVTIETRRDRASLVALAIETGLITPGEPD